MYFFSWISHILHVHAMFIFKMLFFRTCLRKSGTICLVVFSYSMKNNCLNCSHKHCNTCRIITNKITVYQIIVLNMWTSEGLHDCPIQIGYDALVTKDTNRALHDIYFRSVFDRSFVVLDKKRRVQLYTTRLWKKFGFFLLFIRISIASNLS